jgi:hypothetical protein
MSEPENNKRLSPAKVKYLTSGTDKITRENIARCCASCNSSKGTKDLFDWLESNYCKKKNINKNTVAPIVKNALNTKTQLTSRSR